MSIKSDEYNGVRHSSEKEHAERVEHHAVNGDDSNVPMVHDEKILRKALIKLDCFLLTTITIAYLLNFLDRANIGNAKAAGMLEDLNMTTFQYSIALTVTYVPYIVAEFPITMLIKVL